MSNCLTFDIQMSNIKPFDVQHSNDECQNYPSYVKLFEVRHWNVEVECLK